MPYAFGTTISHEEIEGGISITFREYDEALEAKLTGRESIVIDGVLVIRDQAPEEDSVWDGTQWVPFISETTKTTNQNVTQAPSDLFGGPSIKELLNGN